MAQISAGELDRRVILQRATKVRDAENELVETWAEFANVAASKRDTSGRKALANGEIVATALTWFKIRWSPEVRDLSAQDRAICEGVTYEVTEVRELGRREALLFSGVKRAD